MGFIAQGITEMVGKTPLVRLNRLTEGLPGEVVVKLESQNPLSNVKDRIGFSFIHDAEQSGLIKDGTILIEPTSGNTGIAMAFVAAARGYTLTLVIPDTMSIERRKLLKTFGARLILTPGKEGMKNAEGKASEIASSKPESHVIQRPVWEDSFTGGSGI